MFGRKSIVIGSALMAVALVVCSGQSCSPMPMPDSEVFGTVLNVPGRSQGIPEGLYIGDVSCATVNTNFTDVGVFSGQHNATFPWLREFSSTGFPLTVEGTPVQPGVVTEVVLGALSGTYVVKAVSVDVGQVVFIQIVEILVDDPIRGPMLVTGEQFQVMSLLADGSIAIESDAILGGESILVESQCTGILKR